MFPNCVWEILIRALFPTAILPTGDRESVAHKEALVLQSSPIFAVFDWVVVTLIVLCFGCVETKAQWLHFGAAAAHREGSPMLERLSSGGNICRADVREEISLPYYRQGNTRTAKTSNASKNAFLLARITHDTCTHIPSTSLSLLLHSILERARALQQWSCLSCG